MDIIFIDDLRVSTPDRHLSARKRHMPQTVEMSLQIGHFDRERRRQR